MLAACHETCCGTGRGEEAAAWGGCGCVSVNHSGLVVLLAEEVTCCRGSGAWGTCGRGGGRGV